MKRRSNLDIILGVAAIAVILVVAGMLLGRHSMKQNAQETVKIEEGPVVEPVETAQTAAADTEAGQKAEDGLKASGMQDAKVPAEQNTGEKAAAGGIDSQKESEGENAQGPAQEQVKTVLPTDSAADPQQVSGQLEQKAVKAAAVTKRTAKKTKEQRDTQMAELYDYWSRQDRDAVSDVIRLPRNVELSAELEGSDTFYYYGDTTAQGVPNGTGLAVYADNQFYFGGWLNGVRNGEGEWIKVYRYADTVKAKDRLYLEHTYFGEWAGDLPNGEGQEHFDIEASLIQDNDGCVQNVIGKFRDGLYDGEMYIIRLYRDGSVKEWEGTANYGVWNPLGKKNKKGQYPINIRKVDEDNYIWCKPAENVDFGVGGIIAAK